MKKSQHNHLIPPEKYDRRLEWILFLLFLLFLCTQLKNEIFNPDGIGYYSYLRSSVIDHDLFFYNEFAKFKLSEYFFDPSPTGYVQNQWPPGCALLWAPFFLIAHVLTLIAHLLHIPADTSGYSPLYAAAITFGTSIYGFFALLLCFRMLRKLFPPMVCFSAILALWLGTPFFCYQFYFPSMAHVCSAFTVTVFVFLWLRWRAEKKYEDWILLGAAAGLMVMTRTENVVLLVLPIVEMLGRMKRGQRLKQSGVALIFAAAAIVFFTPQMIVWKMLNGNPLSSFQGSVNILWSNSHPFEVLFSSYHGLFSWSPILLLAVIGWFLYAQRDVVASNAFIFAFLALLYVNSCLIWWWGVGAFGARMFVGLFPLFALGLAAFFRQVPRALSAVLSTLCVAWTILLLCQYLTGLNWLVPFFTFRELAEKNLQVILHFFGTSLPILITPKLKGLALAPTLIALIFAALIFFRGFVTVLPVWISDRPRKRRLILLLIAGILLTDLWLLFCWKNSETARKHYSNRMAVLEHYKLEDLYEPFPLEYANYYVKTGRLKTAERVFQRLEELLPDNPAVPIAQAGIYLMEGKTKLAREKAEKAASMHPKHPISKTTLQKIMRDIPPENF